MKHAKRLKKDLIALDKIEEMVNFQTVNTPRYFEYRKYLQDLRKDLEYLSIEKKKDRIRFAKKVLSKNFFNEMSFCNRLILGINFILFGRI